MIYYVVAVLAFLLDRLTKWLVVKKLSLHETVSVIGQFFQITSHRNRGAAFGILQNQRWLFLAITVVVAVAIIFYMQKVIRQRRGLLAFALGLLLGGAIGNFIDRALTGEVVDFLQFRFQFSLFGKDIDYIYPIFNVADSAIVVGVILILVDAFRDWRRERKEKTIHELPGS